jgi:hypothetical protein
MRRIALLAGAGIVLERNPTETRDPFGVLSNLSHMYGSRYVQLVDSARSVFHAEGYKNSRESASSFHLFPVRRTSNSISSLVLIQDYTAKLVEILALLFKQEKESRVPLEAVETSIEDPPFQIEGSEYA